MNWHLYSLTFRIKSPLHIGFHEVMHLSRTRVYVPARLLWSALTANLTRNLKSSCYRECGDFLKKVMRFSYLYLSDEKNIFIPKYMDEGLKFNDLPQIEFEKRFLSSLTSTALDSYSLTAEEGTLHEIEFISPYEISKDEIKPVLLKGLLWVSEKLEDKLTVQFNKDDFSITNGKNDVKFSNLAHVLQIGGERKYGFGQIKLVKLKEVYEQDLEPLGFKGKWKGVENGIIIELGKGDSIWSHVKYNSNLKLKGNIEPLVGRDWSDRGSGRELRFFGLCWTPGSILMEDTVFKVTENFGLWEEALIKSTSQSDDRSFS